MTDEARISPEGIFRCKELCFSIPGKWWQIDLAAEDHEGLKMMFNFWSSYSFLNKYPIFYPTLVLDSGFSHIQDGDFYDCN